MTSERQAERAGPQRSKCSPTRTAPCSSSPSLLSASFLCTGGICCFLEPLIAAAAAEALSGRSPAVLELCFLHEGHHGSRARVPVSLAEPAGSWGAVEHFWGTGSILSPGRISYSRPLS